MPRSVPSRQRWRESSLVTPTRRSASAAIGSDGTTGMQRHGWPASHHHPHHTPSDSTPTRAAGDMPLLRICSCGRLTPKPPCPNCRRARDTKRNAARRTAGHTSSAWQSLSRSILKAWRLQHGEWCPGDEQHGSHPCSDLTCDHVTPISRGGQLLDRGNIRVVCRSANSRRGNR
jgi:5-methylcytosine-specific restriction protein A